MALVLHNAAEAAKRQPKKRKTHVPTIPGGEILLEVQPTDSGREALQRLHKAAHAPSLVTLAAHFRPRPLLVPQETRGWWPTRPRPCVEARPRRIYEV